MCLEKTIKRGEENNRKKLVKTGTILRAFQNNLSCWLDFSVVNEGPRTQIREQMSGPEIS